MWKVARIIDMDASSSDKCGLDNFDVSLFVSILVVARRCNVTQCKQVMPSGQSSKAFVYVRTQCTTAAYEAVGAQVKSNHCSLG